VVDIADLYVATMNYKRIQRGETMIAGEAKDVLKQYFGFDSFLKGQEEIISGILSGRDVLAIMPTGSGKSLCYQIPAMILPGITIVISPLISLMQDQVKALNEVGISAGYINSSLTEVQNVVDTTFGKMSYKIEEFSKNAIKDFGMTELSVKQYASRFQAMGTSMGITGQQVKNAQQFLNMRKTLEGNVAGYDANSKSMADMSINLTKLTSDLASFYEVDQSVVAGKLASGILANQSRPLRDYGINLTDATLKEWALSNGLKANIKDMSQAEKAMLRYQYVMANTTRQQGDFARTSGRMCAA
jgi:Rad3-related DNA helicase